MMFLSLSLSLSLSAFLVRSSRAATSSATGSNPGDRLRVSAFAANEFRNEHRRFATARGRAYPWCFLAQMELGPEEAFNGIRLHEVQNRMIG